MEHQDWETVTFKSKKPKSGAQGVAKARQQGGEVATTKKFNGGGNKQSAAPVPARNLEDRSTIDEDSERLALQTVSRDVARAIQQGRTATGLTQKELATRLNVKSSVVNEYEQGKAIPNNQVLARMERILGVKLRGKNIGSPIEPKAPKNK